MEIEISEQLHNEILFFFLELEKKSGYVDNWEANPVSSGGSTDGPNYSLEEARIENERRSKLPKKVLRFRYFSDYKSKMLEFEKDLTTRGYSNFSFSKKFFLAYPDTNFVSLSISIYSNEGHFSQKFQVPNFQFVEVGGDGTYWKKFSGAELYLLSQNYNYSENQEGQRLKNKIEKLLSKPYENSQKSNKSSNNNHSNQVRKEFNLMDFLIQYLWIILIVGLAVYGFIVQHND